MTPEQLEQAACAGMDLTPFFSDDKAVQQRAKLVCARCPSVRPCFDEAMQMGSDGVAGGYTARERTRIRRGLAPVVPLGRRPKVAS